MNEVVDGSNKYDVFLSFRSVDIGYTFASSLYHALLIKRIKIFYDEDNRLTNHEKCLMAIQESRISIVVLSKHYPYSAHCLDELVNILECMKMKNQVVLPIFYDVDPLDVRRQRGQYGQAFACLEIKYPHRIQQWKEALSQVASIAGWNYRTDREFEYELIEKIVDSTVQSLPRYDVFLNFYGKDTRYSFTGFLYQALHREGFKIFIDNKGFEDGNEISQILLNAIEKSRLSIVVLSKNFGYSTWCLEELVRIMECKKTNNQLVWPLYYKIEQSDVRNQTKSYGEAMTAQENKFGKESENVQKWRSALSEVALLEGDHIKENEYEFEFIKEIVEKAIEAENHM